MKVLYLVPHRVYERKMSRVRFHQMEALALLTRVDYWGPGWPEWDASATAADNVKNLPALREPDVIVTYMVDTLAGVRPPVVTQFNEAFDHTKVERFVRQAGCSLVFFHHQNDVPHYQHWGDAIRRVHLPHAVNTAIYNDYGLPKDIDILVAGNLNDHYYPFRYRLKGLAETVFTDRGYRVTVLKHPGYELPPREGTYVGEAFARVLNRAKLVFTCSMRFNYALAKYSEIAACKALAVADVPAERQDFFRQTILEVSPWQTDAQIVATVEMALSCPDDVRARTRDAYGLTMDYCTMPRYAEGFYHTTRAFLEGAI